MAQGKSGMATDVGSPDIARTFAAVDEGLNTMNLATGPYGTGYENTGLLSWNNPMYMPGMTLPYMIPGAMPPEKIGADQLTLQAKVMARLTGADLRQAKEVLAFEATRILHGGAPARKAQETSRQLFGAGTVSDAVPTTELDEASLAAGIPGPELFQRVGLCNSRSDARRLIQQGGAYVNEAPVAGVDTLITRDHLEDGVILLSAGKKRYHRVVTRAED